jgi:hypothetical protein
MWKLIIYVGLIGGEFPAPMYEVDYLSQEECTFTANSLGTELIKRDFIYDRELSITAEAVVVDNGTYRAAFICMELPGEHV